MPKDRREDRHALPGHLIRPDPKELWDQLGDKVGKRKRNGVISRLIAAYLDGKVTLPDDETPPAD